MTWQVWLKGLIAAFVGGAANGVTVVIVAPDQFNLTAGLGKLCTVCLVSGLVAAALYLKQSPVPDAGSGSVNPTRFVPIFLLAALLSSVLHIGCAGSIRDRVRTSAMTAGEIALTIDQAERNLYALQLPGYTAADHQAAGAKILVMLQDVQAFERAARAWPAGLPSMPSTIAEAQAKALAAVAAVRRIFEVLPPADPIVKTLDQVRSAIGG